MRPLSEKSGPLETDVAEATPITAKAGDLGALLDFAQGALLLVTLEGRVVHTNRIAAVQLGRGKMFRVKNGVLHANRAEENKALHDGLAGLTPERHTAVVCLRSRPGVTVGVLDMRRLAGTVLVALRATDLSLGSAVSATRLVQLFGLTPAEARVTRALGAGLSLSSIAERHGTSIETVRTQIKRARAKTGTPSQAHLIALVAQAKAGLGS